ncbi:hypothetical protein HYQ46_007677 [Verticillium longisporum]|nr:hypothetical protein HYQ46_007677 [Verticillium longisporum]
MLGGGVVRAVVAECAQDDSEPTEDGAVRRDDLGVSYGRYEYASSSGRKCVLAEAEADGAGGRFALFDGAVEGAGFVGDGEDGGAGALAPSRRLVFSPTPE